MFTLIKITVKLGGMSVVVLGGGGRRGAAPGMKIDSPANLGRSEVSVIIHELSINRRTKRVAPK